MISAYGCAGGFKFESYSSKDPGLNLMIDYPSGWIYSEHKGGAGTYSGVVFFEDKKGDVPKALVGLTVKDSSKTGLKSRTLEAFVEDLIAKRSKFKETKLLSKSKMKLSGAEAVILEFTYKTLDKLYSVDAKLILVREKVVVFKISDKFCTIRYENGLEAFSQFNKAFSHMLASLKFKDSQKQ